jgi:hypothetical protein
MIPTALFRQGPDKPTVQLKLPIQIRLAHDQLRFLAAVGTIKHYNQDTLANATTATFVAKDIRYLVLG